MKKFIALLALLIAAPVLADPVEFTVIHPTQYTDNAPITAGVHTPIDCGPTPLVGDFAHGWDFIAQVNTPATTVTANFPVGVWYCAAHSAVVGGTDISDYSAVVMFEIKAPAPAPKSTTPKAPVLKVVLK